MGQPTPTASRARAAARAAAQGQRPVQLLAQARVRVRAPAQEALSGEGVVERPALAGSALGWARVPGLQRGPGQAKQQALALVEGKAARAAPAG